MSWLLDWDLFDDLKSVKVIREMDKDWALLILDVFSVNRVVKLGCSHLIDIEIPLDLVYFIYIIHLLIKLLNILQILCLQKSQILRWTCNFPLFFGLCFTNLLSHHLLKLFLHRAPNVSL